MDVGRLWPYLRQLVESTGSSGARGKQRRKGWHLAVQGMPRLGFLGAKGIYRKRSHFTGIKGIMGMRG